MTSVNNIAIRLTKFVTKANEKLFIKSIKKFDDSITTLASFKFKASFNGNILINIINLVKLESTLWKEKG